MESAQLRSLLKWDRGSIQRAGGTLPCVSSLLFLKAYRNSPLNASCRLFDAGPQPACAGAIGSVVEQRPQRGLLKVERPSKRVINRKRREPEVYVVLLRKF